jgi:hypothetical protein
MLLENERKWLENFKKKPYAVSMQQISELDYLLKKNNLPLVRDKKCGVCIKNAIDILQDFVIKNYVEPIVKPKRKTKKNDNKEKKTEG